MGRGKKMPNQATFLNLGCEVISPAAAGKPGSHLGAAAYTPDSGREPRRSLMVAQFFRANPEGPGENLPAGLAFPVLTGGGP